MCRLEDSLEEGLQSHKTLSGLLCPVPTAPTSHSVTAGPPGPVAFGSRPRAGTRALLGAPLAEHYCASSVPNPHTRLLLPLPWAVSPLTGADTLGLRGDGSLPRSRLDFKPEVDAEAAAVSLARNFPPQARLLPASVRGSRGAARTPVCARSHTFIASRVGTYKPPGTCHTARAPRAGRVGYAHAPLAAHLGPGPALRRPGGLRPLPRAPAPP